MRTNLFIVLSDGGLGTPRKPYALPMKEDTGKTTASGDNKSEKRDGSASQRLIMSASSGDTKQRIPASAH